MREKDVLMFIKEKFDHDITSGWFNCFFIRHIDVLEKVPSTPQDDKRLSVPREFLREHLVNVYKNVEGSCIDLVLKIDEDRKPFKVIVDKNFDGDSIEHSVQRIIPHITMLACFAASGASMTPLIITKRMISEKIWNSGVRKNEEVIRQRDSLYINEQLFLEYLNLVVISYVKVAHQKLRKPFEDAVLMMDSCSYHCIQKVLELLRQNNILAFFYPYHTTNLFQAHDLSLFGLLKKKNQFSDQDNEKMLLY